MAFFLKTEIHRLLTDFPSLISSPSVRTHMHTEGELISEKTSLLINNQAPSETIMNTIFVGVVGESRCTGSLYLCYFQYFREGCMFFL